jgi:hypothetical protein
MRTKILLVLLLIVILNARQMMFTEHKQYLEDIANNMRAKYCSMRGFRGQIYCPQQTFSSEKSDDTLTVFVDDKTSKSTKTEGTGVIHDASFVSFRANVTHHNPKSDEKRDLIISGFGYDRVKRTMKYPIFDSTQSAPVNLKVDHTVEKFNSVRDFLNHVHSHKNQFMGGLYVTNDNELRDLAFRFGDYRVALGTTQRLYITHSSQVLSRTPSPEFTQIVNSLPPYDRNNPSSKQLYDMFLEFFGTDISVNTEHGGIVYQQVAIKSCFGGSITDGMLHDIDALIRRVPPGNTAYLRYRQSGAINILGGNPELDFSRINERINSFSQAPAPVRFSAIPIWDAVADPTRKQWIHAAVQDHINTHFNSINGLMHQVEAARHQNYLSKQNIFHVDVQNEQHARMVAYFIGAPLINNRNSIYTPHFALQKSVVSMAAGENYKSGENNWFNQVILHSYIQRNPQNGHIRQYVVHNGKEIRSSPWISSGCTFVPWGPRWCHGGIGCLNIFDVLRRGVCIDCLPTYEEKPAAFNTRHRFLHCPCSGF